MEFGQLKYFIALAEEPNIGRAAARLNISLAPLTRQIQQLEDEFGAQLFLRTARGIELPQAGDMLLRDARNIRAMRDKAGDRRHGKAVSIHAPRCQGAMLISRNLRK